MLLYVRVILQEKKILGGAIQTMHRPNWCYYMSESFLKKKKLGGAIQTMHRPGCNLVISFKFSAQDIDLEYLFWQQKNSSVSSDLKPPLVSKKNFWNSRLKPWEQFIQTVKGQNNLL